MLGFYFELVDGIVTLSDIDTAWWNLWHPMVFHTINPVTWKYDENLPPDPQNHDILWLARISQEKQPLLALEIMKKVIGCVPDAKLHIVGNAEDASYYQQFVKEIERLNLENIVILHGYQTDVGQYYEKCKIYLSTSAYEGQPVTMVESKIKARPCVTFNLENVDMVREGRGMLVVPQGDIASSANAIVSLLLDPNLWDRLSRDAHESARVICEYDQYAAWRNIIEQISAGIGRQKQMPVNTAVRVQTKDLLTCFNLLGHEINYYRQAFEWNLKQSEYFQSETAYYTERSVALEQQLREQSGVFPQSKTIIKKFRTLIRCIKEYGVKETLKIIQAKLQKLL